MYSVVIVAAGSASRAGLHINKVLHPLCGKPLIVHTVSLFLADERCMELVLVCRNEDEDALRQVLNHPKCRFVQGGNTRQSSVWNGLQEIHSDVVLIHDGARPNLKKAALDRLLLAQSSEAAATLAVPMKDTAAWVNQDSFAGGLNRNQLVLLQTPQAFPTKKIIQAHERANDHQISYSDDATLYFNELNEPVHIVMGDVENIKATTKSDLYILEALLC